MDHYVRHSFSSTPLFRTVSTAVFRVSISACFNSHSGLSRHIQIVERLLSPVVGTHFEDQDCRSR
jgi:hypothetical protein